MINNDVLLFGGINLDHYIHISSFPAKGGDAKIKDQFTYPGGCPLNVASTLYALNHSGHIVSYIGQDGGLLMDYLNANQMSLSCIKRHPTIQSGYCQILLDDQGERTFLTYHGCDRFFEPSLIPKDLLEKIGIIYITGYYLMDKANGLKLLHYLKDTLKSLPNEVIIVFDPGSLIDQIDTDLLQSIISLSHYLLPNEDELQLLIHKLQDTEFVEHYITSDKVLLVKHGKKGASLITKKEHILIEGYPTLTVDGTGSGDSFAGGFIHGLLSDYTLKKCVKWANACGSLTASVLGGQATFSIADVRRNLLR